MRSLFACSSGSGGEFGRPSLFGGFVGCVAGSAALYLTLLRGSPPSVRHGRPNPLRNCRHRGHMEPLSWPACMILITTRRLRGLTPEKATPAGLWIGGKVEM